MENAAKALLIAGGMLLTILTLSLFVYVFRIMAANSANIYDELSESEITEFNQKFLNFERKEKVTMQDVITILNLAIDNNQTEKMPIKIKVYVDGLEEIDKNENLADRPYQEIRNLLSKYFEKTFNSCKISYAEGSNLVETIRVE